MAKNEVKKESKRVKRNADEIAKEKVNKIIPILNRQIENLKKSRKNIIKSGDVELMTKYNFVMRGLSNDFEDLQISASEMTSDNTEMVSDEFDIDNISVNELQENSE